MPSVAPSGGTTAERGKAGEMYVIGELLKRGAMVLTPVVDNKGIDCVVRKKDGTLLELQIKSAFTEYQSGWFDVYDLHLQKVHRFVVVGVDMYCEPTEVWIVPANTFIKYSQQATRKSGSRLFRLNLDSKSRKHSNRVRRDILRPRYLNAWHILT